MAGADTAIVVATITVTSLFIEMFFIIRSDSFADQASDSCDSNEHVHPIGHDAYHCPFTGIGFHDGVLNQLESFDHFAEEHNCCIGGKHEADYDADSYNPLDDFIH